MMLCIFIRYAEFNIYQESVGFASPTNSISSKLTRQTEADKKTQKHTDKI